MRDLSDTMTAAVDLMQEAEPLRQEGRRLEIAASIAKQLIACGHFIRKYTQTSGFGMIHDIAKVSRANCQLSLVSRQFQDTLKDIQSYCKALNDLITRFTDINVVNINIVALRILKTTTNLETTTANLGKSSI
jgi:hypothetical protein